MEDNDIKGGAVEGPKEYIKPLVKQIIREGRIERDEFPLLWPEKLLVTVRWPDGMTP